MKKIFQRSLASLLCVLMFAQSAYAAELIDAYTPEYKYFSTMEVPQDYADENLFWFGSTGMTLSETDPDYYLMRVLRGGDCADEASVTLKFTDVTAAYGTNYRVWAYDSDAEVTGLENDVPMVDFVQQNAKNQYEGEALDQEDVITQMQTPEGAVLKDGSGQSLATLRLTKKAEDGTIQTVSAESNDALVVDAADYAGTDAEQETLYSEEYPGKELTLTFAPGETEKLVAVDPKYSTANDGDCLVTVSLRNPSAGMAYLEEGMTTSITITDEDVSSPAVLSIAQETYFADSDTVEITVTRSGAINEMVCANIVTVSDEGEMGVDFQGADATLYFPMGIQERTVSLQVNHIRDEQVDFQVKLVNPQGCTVDRAEATVTIATAAEVEEVLLMEEAAAEKQMMAASVLEGSAASVTLNALSNMPGGTAEAAAEADDAAVTLAEEPETEAAAAETAEETPAAATAAAEAAPAAEEAAEGKEDAEREENAENALPASDNDYSDIPYVETDPAYAPAGTGTGAAEAAESDDDLTVELCEDILCLPSSSYRIKEIPNTNFVGFGKGWNVGEQAYHYSCCDVAYDTWNGMKVYMDNPYLYDGVRTRVNAKHDYWWCTSYLYIKVDEEERYYTEDDNFNRRMDIIFGKVWSNEVRFEALTSYGHGLYGEVEWVAPIYREFKFTLTDAKPLEFVGVDSKTAKTYTATTMGAGDKEECTECTLSIGEKLTVSAPASQKPYARLAAVDFVGKDGKVLYTAHNDTNSRSITVTLTKDVLNALATEKTEFKKNTVNGKDCYIGQISVRPVYEHIPATVTVETSTYGSFDGDYAVTDAPLTLQMNLGDCIKLSSTIYSQYARKYVASGVRYKLLDGQNKTITNGSGTLDYNDQGNLTFTVTTQNLVLQPEFTANDNIVQVWVKNADLKFFDTESPLFKSRYQVDDGYTVYTVSADTVNMDALVPLSAKVTEAAAAAGKVPLWSVGGKIYSGKDFFHVAGRTKASNKIILSLGDAATYQMTGCAYHADINLSTGISSANPIIPAIDAVIGCADASAFVADDGSFTLDEVKGAANTWARLIVYSGNSWVTKDVFLHDDEPKINLGIITTAANTTDTACFTNIFAWQNSYLVTDAEVLHMDSKPLKLTAIVEDNVSYLVGGKTRTEKVTGVSFYVVDGTTHQIKFEIKATQEEAGVWTGKIDKFTPDNPDSWYYGDVIYVAMSTDRVASLSYDENHEIVESTSGTTYAMLSTGYQIAAGNTESNPQKISFDPKVDADSAQGDAALSEESSDSTTRKTRGYAQLPFLGAINTFVKVAGTLKQGYEISGSGIGDVFPSVGDSDNNDNDDNDNGAEDSGDDDRGEYVPSSGTKWSVQIIFSFDTLPYGGTRLKIGVMASTSKTGKNGAWTASSPYDRYKSYRPDRYAKTDEIHDNDKLEYNPKVYNGANVLSGSNGVPQMTFAFFFGIYLDFGAVVDITEEGNGDGVESSLDKLYLLGAGGFFGMSGSVKYQWFTLGPCAIPVFWGFIGSMDITGYLGATVDPNEQLNRPMSLLYDDDGNMTLDGLSFNVDVVANASIKGYAGVGLPDILSGRIIASLDVAFSYCPMLQDYYPAIHNSWGLGLSFTLGGQFDLVFFTIPVKGFSIPLVGMGFNKYFGAVRKTYRLWDYIQEELEENGGNYTEEQIAKANGYLDQLVSDLNQGADAELLAKHYATAYNYFCDTNMLTGAEIFALDWTKSDLDIWTLEDDTAETAAGTAATSEEMLTEDGYVLMQHTGSEWVADESVALSGSFREASTQTLINWSYSQTNPSMVDIGNGYLLAIFLEDTSSAGEIVDPTLVYSIYNEASGRWTRPVAVADDGTADYTPHLCDAGDQVILTWSSAGITDSSNANAVLKSMEIWTATFNKATMTMGTPVQLTNDSYMDYNPQAIYDNETDNVAVYYVKHDAKAEDDILNYIVGESVLCYRLYDAESKAWVIDYYDEEMPKNTEEDNHSIGVKYNGERYLSSAVGEDRPIMNLTVADGYNGLGIYAYTIDLDGDTSDNSDTELYLRLYDFRTHRTYAPIRVTDDEVSQSLPQLVRTAKSYKSIDTDEEGQEVVTEYNGTTYLFWLENDNEVKYLNATDLFHNGITPEGKLLEGYADVCTTPVSFDSGEGEMALANYEALTDDAGNLYLVWSQAAESADEEKNKDTTVAAPEELFAAALIQEVPEAVQHTDDGVEGGIDGSSWSAAVRLTTDESHNDGATGVIGDDGTLYMLHNRYEVTYVGFAEDAAVDEETGCIEGNPYEINDTRLCFSTFEPIATVDATEFTFSDETPAPGDTIQVTAKLENTGLTTAKGYTAVFSECRNGVAGNVLHTASQEEWLVANEADYVTFDWTVPEDFDQVTIQCAGFEQGYSEPAVTYSEALEKTAAYEVAIGNVIQNGDKFTVDYTITNTGSLTAGDDEVLRAEFAGLYGQYDTIYGLETDKLGEISIAGLAPNETTSGVMEISVPEQAFDYCGYDAVELTVYNGEGTALSEGASNYMVLTTPVEATAEAETDLVVGNTEKINAILKSGFFSKRGYKPYYSSDNNSVATVSEDGTITAKGAGSAAITVTFAPYGTTAELKVSVAESEQTRNKFVDVPASAYYAPAVYWGVAKGIVAGTSDTTFSPDSGCTRAQFVTFLWRAAGCPEPESTACSFTDVSAKNYYYKAVLWGVEEGIVAGTSKTTFSPDKTCTRAQAATFLWRYNGYVEPDTTTCKFADVAADQYYYKPVLWGVENGIIYGTGSTTYSPNKTCTRAQAIAFLYRLLNK